MLLVMGWDMIDETACQRSKAVSLTCCWSRYETWLMRLSGKEIKQWLSTHILLIMGWDMIDETAWKRNKVVPHLLLVMGWDMTDENVWQKNKTMSLTPCWSWDAKTWLMRLPGKDSEIKQCHSLPVGHGMRHDWWDYLANKESCSVTHWSILKCDMHD